MVDAARKQELVIESLPDPPQDDLDKRLSKLKKFNKRLLDDKKVKIAECDAEILENGVPKVVTKRVKVTENENEVVMKEMRGNNDNNYHDKTEVLVDKISDGNNSKKHINEETIEDALYKIHDEDEYWDIIEEKEIVDQSLDKTNERSRSDGEIENHVNVNDDEYEDEASKSNTWDYGNLEKETCFKVNGKFNDKVHPETRSKTEKGLEEELMYK